MKTQSLRSPAKDKGLYKRGIVCLYSYGSLRGASGAEAAGAEDEGGGGERDGAPDSGR